MENPWRNSRVKVFEIFVQARQSVNHDSQASLSQGRRGNNPLVVRPPEHERETSKLSTKAETLNRNPPSWGPVADRVFALSSSIFVSTFLQLRSSSRTNPERRVSSSLPFLFSSFLFIVSNYLWPPFQQSEDQNDVYIQYRREIGTNNQLKKYSAVFSFEKKKQTFIHLLVTSYFNAIFEFWVLQFL